MKIMKKFNKMIIFYKKKLQKRIKENLMKCLLENHIMKMRLFLMNKKQIKMKKMIVKI